MKPTTTFLSLAAFLLLCSPAFAADPAPDAEKKAETPAAPPAAAQIAEPPNNPAKINVYPPDVNLTALRDRQSVIVQAVYADGVTRDVTADAKFTLADGNFVRIDKNILHPVGDGQTALKIEYGGHTAELPVNVAGGKKRPTDQFST